MNKLIIMALPVLLFFSGKMYAASEATVQDSLKCSTVVLTNKETKELIVATTTCPSSEKFPGTVTKMYPDGKTTVLQNGQLVTIE